MTEAVFAAEPTRLLIAAAAGIILLLLLIIKFKIHPVLSLLISALFIGLGAGMPVPTLVSTVEKGAGETLQGIVLLIGLGSLFGGILEVSGGAQCVAQTLVNKFGEKKAGIALGITGLVVGTTVFFEAGVVILIPLAFGLAKKTKKSTLYYVIPLLAGLATGFAFIPPSAGSVLVANMLNVDLGVMIAVGVPVGMLSLIFAGILWSKYIGSKIDTGLPSNIQEVREADEANLPKFSTVLCIILVPLVLILCSTVSEYIPGIDAVRPVLEFLGTPFVALVIAVLFAMYFLGRKQGYDGEQMKKILDRSLRPTGQILLVITGGGIIRWVLQDCGMGDIIGPALEKSGLPLVLVAFLIAALIRASVGAAVVAMTMAAGIMAAMPGVAELSPVYLAAMVCAINGGAPANVAVAASRLGAHTAFIGKAGNDMHGEFLRSVLQKEKVDTKGLLLDDQYFTTLAFVDVNASGERTFSFARKPGADTKIKKEEIDVDVVDHTSIFHVGSLSLTDQPSRDTTFYAVKRAKNKGSIISYDPNYRASLWTSEETAMKHMRSLISYVDVMKISDEETELLTGYKEVEKAAEALFRQGVKIVAVTLGGNGAYIYCKDGGGIIPGFAVEHVADTNGAGDSFWGGFLYKLSKAGEKPEDLTKEEIAKYAEFGNAVASLCVEKKGAIPAMPCLEQVKERMAGK